MVEQARKNVHTTHWACAAASMPVDRTLMFLMTNKTIGM
jgi:hypothetical protein